MFTELPLSARPRAHQDKAEMKETRSCSPGAGVRGGWGVCVASCLQLSLALGWPSQDRVCEMEEGERPARVHRLLSHEWDWGGRQRSEDCEQPGGDWPGWGGGGLQGGRGVSAAQFARMLGWGGRAGLSHLPPQAGLHPDPELCGAQRVPAACAQGSASIREGGCRSDF